MSSGEDDFDYGGESDKLGGIPGVLRLRDGDELTLLVTGPFAECTDRFGTNKPTTKYALGVYCFETRKRGVVLNSWKAKNDWDEENKKRPFKTHFVRWGRVGTGKEATRYNVASIPGVTDAHRQEAKAAEALPLGSVQATADEVTRRAREKGDYVEGDGDSNGNAPAAAAPRAGGGAPIPAAGGRPGGGAPIPTAGGAPVPAAGGAPIPAKTGGKVSVIASLEQIVGWLEAPGANVPAIANAAKPLLVEAVGKDKVGELAKKHGIVSGQVPTDQQLHGVVSEALSMIRPAPAPPAPAMAAGMGVADDDLPF